VWVFRSVARGHPARPAAATAMGAIIGEALIGAVIVLFEWVAGDTSVARTISVPLHLVNTFLLLAALALTAHWVGGGLPISRRSHPSTWRWVMGGAGALLIVAASGAVTALADTLFPKDGPVSPTAEHFLTDLRVVHPILALTVVSVAWVVVRRRGLISREVNLMVVLVGLQVASGAVAIALEVPIVMQVLHLALADLLWVAYVVTSARLLAVEPAGLQARRDLRASGSSSGASQTNSRHK
ncbi:MAG: COX15/CtaA family protein, partial [Acidimicrobiia bacterium]